MSFKEIVKQMGRHTEDDATDDNNGWLTHFHKNTKSVKANMVNISIKFQPHRPNGFWGINF